MQGQNFILNHLLTTILGHSNKIIFSDLYLYSIFTMTAFVFSNNYFYQQKYILSQCWRLFSDWKRQKNSTRKFQIKNVLWRNNPSSVKWERQRFVDCLKYQMLCSSNIRNVNWWQFLRKKVFSINIPRIVLIE